MIFEKINVEEINLAELMDSLDDAISIMRVCTDATGYHDARNMEDTEWLMGETTNFMEKLRGRIGSEFSKLRDEKELRFRKPG